MATSKDTSASVQRKAAGRVRSARSDALVTKMQATIESAFGLPEGSVQLVPPRRSSKLDATSTVGDLRALWANKK